MDGQIYWIKKKLLTGRKSLAKIINNILDYLTYLPKDGTLYIDFKNVHTVDQHCAFKIVAIACLVGIKPFKNKHIVFIN
jgi:hypothetical protein